MKFILAALLLCASTAMAMDNPVSTTPPVLSSRSYASQLGVGIVVDWARTEKGIREFDPMEVRDFQQRGIGHVRIRVAGEATHQSLVHLQRIVEACQGYNIVPIISYQADDFKITPNATHEAQVVAWWTDVARYFAQSDPRLGFDIIYEPSERINPAMLANLYEKVTKAIHKITPQRMVFIAPSYHAPPENLANMKWPEQNQDTLLAEWHIFPAGPVPINGRRPWTTGTDKEKAAIRARINSALRWQKKTGHSSWVGAWSMGEIAKNIPDKQQLAFANFMACELQKVHIPYAVNGDIKFYDGEEGAWRAQTQALLDAIIKPQCT